MTDEPFHIDLTQHDDTPLHLARAEAINAYAMLEQSLCGLFALLAQVDARTAGIIFFKIVNTRARLSIIEKLMKYRFPNEPTIFFNSIVTTARRIDGQRNEVVHWVAATHINADHSVTFSLMHPDFTSSESSDPFDEKRLKEFGSHCGRYASAINGYAAHLGGVDLPPAWREIFEQPLVYPLPADHPLRRIGAMPPTQPKS